MGFKRGGADRKGVNTYLRREKADQKAPGERGQGGELDSSPSRVTGGRVIGRGGNELRQQRRTIGALGLPKAMRRSGEGVHHVGKGRRRLAPWQTQLDWVAERHCRFGTGLLFSVTWSRSRGAMEAGGIENG